MFKIMLNYLKIVCIVLVMALLIGVITIALDWENALGKIRYSVSYEQKFHIEGHGTVVIKGQGLIDSFEFKDGTGKR